MSSFCRIYHLGNLVALIGFMPRSSSWLVIELVQDDGFCRDSTTVLRICSSPGVTYPELRLSRLKFSWLKETPSIWRLLPSLVCMGRMESVQTTCCRRCSEISLAMRAAMAAWIHENPMTLKIMMSSLALRFLYVGFLSYTFRLISEFYSRSPSTHPSNGSCFSGQRPHPQPTYISRPVLWN